MEEDSFMIEFEHTIFIHIVIDRHPEHQTPQAALGYGINPGWYSAGIPATYTSDIHSLEFIIGPGDTIADVAKCPQNCQCGMEGVEKCNPLGNSRVAH